MRKHEMLLPGERVAAGISGGADSVCLLFVLAEWKKRYGSEVAAVHVNHGIRREAAEDARFVEELCKSLGIPFYLRETDVHVLARERKLSVEEAGRNFRYQAFREAAEDFGAKRIAVAHNLNDRGETMLFNLFRGTGLKGLAGIMPVRDNVIRPLLCVERREIEEYLKAKGQTFCTDTTNEDDEYTRNRIRHHILPYVEKEIVSGCVKHMGQTAEIAAEAEDYLEQQTGEAYAQCAEHTEKDGYVLDCAQVSALHPAISKRLLFKLLKELSPGAKDISSVHVAAVYDLFLRSGNREIVLPFGIKARREYAKVRLETGSSVIPEPEHHLEFQVFSAEELPVNDKNSVIFPENQYTKWFDYDKIIRPLKLRTRSTGDYLMILGADGAAHHKKLKDYMVNEKIPERERDRIPILAEDAHVLWVVGHRISEYYKITANTKRVLQVQWITDCMEDKDGRAY